MLHHWLLLSTVLLPVHLVPDTGLRWVLTQAVGREQDFLGLFALGTYCEEHGHWYQKSTMAYHIAPYHGIPPLWYHMVPQRHVVFHLTMTSPWPPGLYCQANFSFIILRNSFLQYVLRSLPSSIDYFRCTVPSREMFCVPFSVLCSLYSLF